MVRLTYAERALDDLERLVDFLRDAGGEDAALEVVSLVAGAVDVLVDHPLIGRPVERDLRELLISRGRTGYVALYSFEVLREEVLILGFRHQRELDIEPL